MTVAVAYALKLPAMPAAAFVFAAMGANAYIFAAQYRRLVNPVVWSRLRWGRCWRR
ncbi:hypothetical protein [Bradyrhizobium sp. Bra64]|uniref:hypothetical protein n=1 Tax=Bradyrhizobium sp. Bra64 TaxID=2926009 RepID=UPI002117F0CB|nr:hypothetical protein [Bradyrhizobium sp. Bra64]